MEKLNKLYKSVFGEGVINVGAGNINLVKNRFKKLGIKIDKNEGGKVYINNKSDSELRKIWRKIIDGKESLSKESVISENIGEPEKFTTTK